MSTSVHDILGAIGDAQRALSAEPQYRNEISELQKRLDEAMRHSQALELKISGYKDNVDTLQSKVRSLEVERDDTGFRLLESEDKLDKLLKAIRTAESGISSAVNAADPPKPEPVAPQATMAQALHTPLPAPSYVEPLSVADHMQNVAQPQWSQSEPHPTASSPQEGQSSTVHSDTASVTEHASTDKPYAGKQGHSFPHVGYKDWIAGGGAHNEFWQ